MTKRLIYASSLSEVSVANDKVTTPVPGVVYCEETDLVYFNNVVLPQGGSPVNVPTDTVK